MTLGEVNGLDEEGFVSAFGAVAEDSPWIARLAARRAPFSDGEALIAAFHQAIDDADHDSQLQLLRAHPDLAGGAARAGRLAEASQAEQKGARLDALSEEEFARFERLNAAYRARFGFPFILAVKGATKHDILAAFEARLPNSPEQEFETALQQVKRIVRFRLEALVDASGDQRLS
jgi:2-oxo-4-hydroxy-4-carboxy-5-ureidoimidazoline decarboxylase